MPCFKRHVQVSRLGSSVLSFRTSPSVHGCSLDMYQGKAAIYSAAQSAQSTTLPFAGMSDACFAECLGRLHEHVVRFCYNVDSFD